MISTSTMLLTPVLPSAFCGAMSAGRRALGWLVLSWVLKFFVVRRMRMGRNVGGEE